MWNKNHFESLSPATHPTVVEDRLIYTVCDKKCIYSPQNLAFTALHGMQTRSRDKNSVRPSVCLSVKHVNCDKTGEKSV